MHQLESIADLLNLDFDEIIDVRSPAEFADDHVIGAVNLPVLNDDERARVGEIYTRESRFRANRLGAALVARNIACHLEGHLAEKPGSYRPLIYCWRGGERSRSMTEILGRVGWRAESLAGGYRSYRRLVSDQLYVREFPAPVILLEGNTGTAKTALLQQLGLAGAQIIDLEGLAGHRGSLFGATGDDQPTQKSFESALAERIVRLDPQAPVVVEAESSRIGERQLPPSMWAAMQAARRIEICAPVAMRVRHILAEFAELAADRARLEDAIRRLGPFHSSERIADWRRLAADRKLELLVHELIVHHYDPRYRKHREKTAARPLFSIELSGISAGRLAEAAGRILAQAGLASRQIS